MTKTFKPIALVYLLFLFSASVLTGNTALAAGTLVVTSPDGGESWTAGKKYTIKWKKGNAGSFVKIELLRSGKVYKTVKSKTKNDGKYRWQVPTSVKNNKNYKIRITSSTKGSRSDSSNLKFTIKKAASGDDSNFKVISPNGGESLQQGTAYMIEWNTGDIGGQVIIELRTGSGTDGSTALEISAQTKNDGRYRWKVPTTVGTGSNYQIRVRSIKSRDQVDTSDTSFSITQTASLTLTSAALKDGKEISEKYTCDGGDTHFRLSVSGIDSDAKRLVLFLDDLDGSPTATNTTTDWSHWVVFNIPKVSSINPYSLPAGSAVGTNDAGDRNYDSICPPGEKDGRAKHNYRFTLYSIDAELNLGQDATRAKVVTAMDGKILQKKTLTGYFGIN